MLLLLRLYSCIRRSFARLFFFLHLITSSSRCISICCCRNDDQKVDRRSRTATACVFINSRLVIIGNLLLLLQSTDSIRLAIPRIISDAARRTLRHQVQISCTSTATVLHQWLVLRSSSSSYDYTWQWRCYDSCCCCCSCIHQNAILVANLLFATAVAADDDDDDDRTLIDSSGNKRL